MRELTELREVPELAARVARVDGAAGAARIAGVVRVDRAARVAGAAGVVRVAELPESRELQELRELTELRGRPPQRLRVFTRAVCPSTLRSPARSSGRSRRSRSSGEIPESCQSCQSGVSGESWTFNSWGGHWQFLVVSMADRVACYAPAIANAVGETGRRRELLINDSNSRLRPVSPTSLAIAGA